MPLSLVLKKALPPIVSTLAGITSVPVMRVLRKALVPIDSSEAAPDRSRPVSLVCSKA